MKNLRKYVLVLASDSHDLQSLESLVNALSCPVAIAYSITQAISQATQILPFLIIVAGDRSEHLITNVRQLRRTCSLCEPTILILTESHTPRWFPPEDSPGFDGYLVQPLASDILVSLVESAWARHSYCQVG